jgi:hypothetical protein
MYDENIRYITIDADAGVEPAQAGPEVRRPAERPAPRPLRAG